MKRMKRQKNDVLVDESVRLTKELRSLQAQMAVCGKERRNIWQELNNRGISQRRLASACGVVEHTVYTELRKRREAAA
jgi:IS30 family transposase